jgi:site-specific DNA-methyltransferase (adenine-specific)
MLTKPPLEQFLFDYRTHAVGRSQLIHTDCLDWLSRMPDNSIHAVVTDPPYGVKEYEFDQIEKRDIGVGGIWRIPPSFDGCKRAPLPRFTALTKKERDLLSRGDTSPNRLEIDLLELDRDGHCGTYFLQPSNNIWEY